LHRKREQHKLDIEEQDMKTGIAIITAGFFWFGTIYFLVYTSAGTLLTTIA
jgi:hypothetical protein